jgi:hypothetical protein
MREAFEAAGFVVVRADGDEYELEAPRFEFVGELGEVVTGDFEATVDAGADGVVIELEHVSHGSALRPVYGRDAAAAARAAWLAVADWFELGEAAASARGDDYE